MAGQATLGLVCDGKNAVAVGLVVLISILFLILFLFLEESVDELEGGDPVVCDDRGVPVVEKRAAAASLGL